MLFSFAQNATTQDNVTARLSDTAQLDNFYKKEKIFAKQTLVPIAFIGYGAAALGVQGLKNFNKNIQKKIWTNNPHSVTHIDNYWQFAPGASVYILNLSGIEGKHNLKDATFIYALSNLFVTGAVQTTKRLSHEWRPDGSDRYSFPSGHTATAFANAEFLRLEYKDVSVWYGVGGYAVAAFTGYLRMYNNKHWFSDVLAGAGVGVLSTDLAYYLYPSLQNIFSHKKKNYSAVIFPTYQQGAVGLSLAYKW
jgi:membrane-associated phospholipid phosphatase